MNQNSMHLEAQLIHMYFNMRAQRDPILSKDDRYWVVNCVKIPVESQLTRLFQDVRG